jgi:tetratricopeptide (TPR) repeat protein
MANYQAFLQKLNQNLQVLQEREAKYGGNAPLELLNQIEDHRNAIDLTRQVITDELSEIEWQEGLKPLLVSLNVFGRFFDPGIPLQRPPRAEYFTDRKQELAQLLVDLQPGRVVTLCGPGGIGKSALAAEAVWTLAPEDDPPDRFPDGVIFHSFSSQPQADVALENIARTFGEEPKPTPAAAAQRALAGRRALLLLDSAEDADDLSRVHAVAAGCGILVTSRLRKNAIAERQDIAPLPSDKAVALLKAWGGDRAADDEVVNQICDQVGSLPLAVRLIGRYLAEVEEEAADYLQWLEKTPLQALDLGQRRNESVTLLLERSLEQISEEARQVLATVGLLALAPFDRGGVAAALEVSKGQIGRWLAELVSYGLLLREERLYEVSHTLIHTYARQRLATPIEAVRRLAAYYTVLAREQNKLGLEGYARLDVERLHVLSVLRRCIEREEWEIAQGLALSVDHYLEIQGYWTDRITAIEVGLAAAQNLGHRRNEATFFGNLGSAHWSLGQVEKAINCHKQALAISREIRDRRGESQRLGSLGLAYRDLGQMEEAINYLKQALPIAHKIGERRSEESLLGSLGLAYRDLGQVEEAIRYYERALVISHENGNQQGEGIWLGNLGTTYRYLGQLEKAIEYHEQALVIAREIGDRRFEGSWLGNLGQDYQDLGQVKKVIEYYEQAQAISQEIGDRRKEIDWLGGLGNAYRGLGHVEKAIEYYEQALIASRQIGHRRKEGTELSNLGNAYRDLGQLERAIKYYKWALTIAREIGDRRGEAMSLHNIGEVYKDQANTAFARQFLAQALAIFEKIDAPRAKESRRLLAELED